MKIDISTVLLVVLCVIPGLFAQRSRNLVCPRSFDEQGASAELGELVALGISTHGILLCLASLVLLILGFCHGHFTSYFFTKLDAWPVQLWTSRHPIETLLFGTLYVFISFAFSHWFGLVYGVWRFRIPVTSLILGKSNFFTAKFLKRLGVNGLLGERPILYEAFRPRRRIEDGLENLVFVEVELKDNLGFYAGQLSQFAIIKDDEPHKPIYLISAFFKLRRTDTYEAVDADGILIDLAEAVLVRVKQSPPGS